MSAVIVVCLTAVGFTLLLVGATWWWARSIAEKMRRQDAALRPMEAQTGRCGACDGAGTRIEVSGGRSPSQHMVDCYRCGGTGEPPDDDRIPDLTPSPLAFDLRRLRAWLSQDSPPVH